MAGNVLNTERQSLLSGLQEAGAILIIRRRLTYQLDFKIKNVLGISHQQPFNE